MRTLPAASVLSACLAAACSGTSTPPPAANTPAPQVPLAQLPKVDPVKILDHIKALSADDMEGRAPGTAGEEKTVAYVEGQFKALGLQPGNPDGTYCPEGSARRITDRRRSR
jgi:hypothetical protein